MPARHIMKNMIARLDHDLTQAVTIREKGNGTASLTGVEKPYQQLPGQPDQVLSIVHTMDFASAVQAIHLSALMLFGMGSLYIFLRPRLPRIYSPRVLTPRENNPETAPKGYLSWVMPLVNESDEDFIRAAGVDAFVMLRLCRLGFKFCGLCLIPWALFTLIVRHGMGAMNPTEAFTLSHMPVGSPLLWVHLGGAMTATILLLVLLHEEQTVQLKLRHKYLQQPRARQLSVVVRDLPPQLQRSSALLAKFREFYGHDEVVRAYVGTDCRAIEKLIKKAEAVRNDLEYADLLWRKGLSDERPKQLLHDRLCILNAQIRTGQAAITEGDGDLAAAGPLSSPGVLPGPGGGAARASETQPLLHGAVEKTTTVGVAAASAVGLYTDPNPRVSGIVTFSTFRAVNTAMQLIHTNSYKDFHLRVSSAPEPTDIIWKNMGLTWRQRQVRKLWSNMMSACLTVFWAIPVIVTTALTSIDPLSKDFPELKPFLSRPFVAKFVQGSLPAIILSSVMALLPIFLRMLTEYEGCLSTSRMQQLVVQKYFFFLIFNVFLVSAIAGSLLDSLGDLFRDPTSLPSKLGQAVPFHANFYVSYILMNGPGYRVPAQMLRVGRLCNFMGLRRRLTSCFWARGNAGWAAAEGEAGLGWRTERERQQDLASRALPYEEVVPIYLLTLTLACTFAVLAPIILVVSCISFGVSYVSNKYMCKYVYTQSNDSGGALWPSVFGNMVSGLVISQLTLIGIFGLKQANLHQMTMMVALLVITLVFWWTKHRRFDKLSKFLPLADAMAADSTIAAGGIRAAAAAAAANGGLEKDSKTVSSRGAGVGGEWDYSSRVLKPKGRLDMYAQPSLRRGRITKDEFVDACGTRE